MWRLTGIDIAGGKCYNYLWKTSLWRDNVRTVWCQRSDGINVTGMPQIAMHNYERKVFIQVVLLYQLLSQPSFVIPLEFQFRFTCGKDRWQFTSSAVRSPSHMSLHELPRRLCCPQEETNAHTVTRLPRQPCTAVSATFQQQGRERENHMWW